MKKYIFEVYTGEPENEEIEFLHIYANTLQDATKVAIKNCNDIIDFCGCREIGDCVYFNSGEFFISDTQE